jgi:hypothetical protein
MSTTKTENTATKVVTDPVRLSYLHVFQPTSINEQSEKKYSVSIIVPKSNTKLVDKLNKAIKAALELGKPKWGGKIPPNLKMPMRDGDIDRPDDEAYKGAYFINASSKTKPTCVDLQLNAILDANEMYSGCYGRVSINFYPFNSGGSKGIAAGLNNLQKTKDGEPLSGRPTAEADFGDGYQGDDDEEL